MITVVNQRNFDLPKHVDETVSIARPGIWGNDFLIGRDGTREQVIDKYKAQLWERIESAETSILNPLRELAERANEGDLYLACYCKPLPCHGDVLKEAIEWMQTQVTIAATETSGGQEKKKDKHIGITGHRDYNDRDNGSRNLIRFWMTSIKKRYPEATIITGGAIGVDIIAAEEAITAGLKSKVMLPMLFDVFTSGWGKKSKACLQTVLDQSEVIIISVENAKEILAKDPDAYIGFLAKYDYGYLFERNQAIVDDSNLLIAFWDGRQKGGTFDTVKRGLDAGIDVFQGIPLPAGKQSKKEKVFSQIQSDLPLADEFRTDEACIEGWEALQERVGGWQHYGQSAALCDFEYSGGTVYERHEVIGDDDSQLAVEARVTASCLCFPWEAKQIAAEIMDFGLEYESYWRGRLKADFDGTWKELSRLSWAMAQETPSPLDALEHEWKQSYNDDPSEDTEEIIVDATHGWHRVGDGRGYIDAELPLPKVEHPEAAAALYKRLQEAPSIRTFGKELFDIQKSGKLQLPNKQWSWLWSKYREARDGVSFLPSVLEVNRTSFVEPETFSMVAKELARQETTLDEYSRRKCEYCGQPLSEDDTKYCSNECRDKVKAIAQERQTGRRCKHCGRKLSEDDAKYCSDECREKVITFREPENIRGICNFK